LRYGLHGPFCSKARALAIPHRFSFREAHAAIERGRHMNKDKPDHKPICTPTIPSLVAPDAP
jgi:hypothetical protein